MALGMVCLSCVRTWWMYALTCAAIFCVCLSVGEDLSSAFTSDTCMPVTSNVSFQPRNTVLQACKARALLSHEAIRQATPVGQTVCV